MQSVFVGATPFDIIWVGMERVENPALRETPQVRSERHVTETGCMASGDGGQMIDGIH